MDNKVLVTYATKHGSTAEIAEKIGEIMRQEGLSVDVLPAEKAQTLEPYTAVILGSAVYVGKWRDEAADFLKENEAALAARDVWLFSSGPTGEGDPVALMDDWVLPPELKPVAERVAPREITVFHGDIDPSELGLLEKMAIKAVKAPTGDFRDWEAISEWATAVAEQIKAPVS
jgi:menaquinone-dependent protoporphyrinogen oxidase